MFPIHIRVKALMLTVVMMAMVPTVGCKETATPVRAAGVSNTHAAVRDEVPTMDNPACPQQNSVIRGRCLEELTKGGQPTPSSSLASPAPTPAAAAAPTGLSFPVPPRPQGVTSAANMQVAYEVYIAARAKGISPDHVIMRALFSAILVESQCNNLPHLGKKNDHNSLGVLQQRPGETWGTPAQIMNVTHATGSFVYAARKVLKKTPRISPGDLAQKVQISAYPRKYPARMAEADRLLAAFRKAETAKAA